jgi:hypothetical protein
VSSVVGFVSMKGPMADIVLPSATENGGAGPEGDGVVRGHARPSLLMLLAEASVASEEELRLALAEGMQNGERLGQVVLQRGWLDDKGLGRIVARQWGLPFREEPVLVDPDAAVVLPTESAGELRACPIVDPEGGTYIALAEPTDDRLAAIRAEIGAESSIVLVTLSTLDRLLTEMAAAETPASVADRRAATETLTNDDADAAPPPLVDELNATWARLGVLHEQVRRLLAADEQSSQELSECQRLVAELTAARDEDQSRLQVLETELRRHQERVAAVRAKLTDASETLDG